MTVHGRLPGSGTDRATDSGHSWHTDDYLIALAARGGLFWSATLRIAATVETPEPHAAAPPETILVGSPAVGGAPPAQDSLVGAIELAPASSSAPVGPLVMASLCNLLYDAPGEQSKPGWTPQQWDAALQQQASTASWRFLAESNGNPQVYFGVAFENIDTGQTVIASRGTETVYDLLVSDIDILKGITPPAFLAAAQFAAQVATACQEPGRQILVTGHSLGGADAEYQAAKLGLGGDTFAALGARFAAPENAPNLVNYLFPQDAVANLAAHIGPVDYIEPNGTAQWIDLLATRQYAGEGLHFLNNYLEHFGAPGIAPITPGQYLEAVVLADVAKFFSQDTATLAATPQFGFDDLASPAALSAVPTAPSMPAGGGSAVNADLVAMLHGATMATTDHRSA